MTEPNGTNGASEPKPVFNLYGLSWREGRRLQFMHAKVLKAIEEENEAAIEALYVDIEKLYSSIVVSVPREWLIPGAPETIDWSNTDSWQWISSKGFALLQKTQVEASTPEETTKNSQAASS